MLARRIASLLVASTRASHSAAQSGVLDSARTAFFLCDMQERFRNVIFEMPHMITVAGRMIAAAKAFDIPVIVTEQYPKVFGATVAELDVSTAALVAPKTQFSMVVPEVMSSLKGLKGGQIDTVVLFGIEAHICVQQTALDLARRGFGVHVVADGVSSQQPYDRRTALQRMPQSGVFVTTHQSVVYGLLGRAEGPAFKALVPVFREPLPNDKL
eukprot:Amastigsp_a341904_42.p1 type:complete len:213 gc:universal Amastigsp_a341904_42:749-111(-)